MPAVECACCGHALAVPDDLREGAGFTCGHCGLMLRNVESARRFRWAELDPFVRRHGVDRAHFWAGILGSLAWLPVLAIVLAVGGSFDLGLFVAVAAPYLVMLAVMKQRRPRTPAVLWVMHQWIALGAYCLYLWVLVVLVPGWGDRLLGASGTGVMRAMLLTLGAGWILVGFVGAWFYRLRARRLPSVSGTPPAR